MAAALIRSTGLVHVRTTKGMVLIVTLLSLVCFANSLLDKSQLAELKETHEKLKQYMERIKAKLVSSMSADSLGSFMNSMDPLIEQVKNHQKDLPDDFPWMDSLLDQTKAMLEKTKAWTDGKHEELVVKMQDTEEKLRNLKDIIDVLEKLPDEL